MSSYKDKIDEMMYESSKLLENYIFNVHLPILDSTKHQTVKTFKRMIF